MDGGAGEPARRPYHGVVRIVSLLPTGTEVLLALGAGDELVGISHDNLHIAAVRHLPVVSQLTYEDTAMTSEEIDRLVTRTYAAGGSIYRLDEARLRALRPDLLIAQDLCEVCAVTPNDFQALLTRLDPQPRVLSLRAGTLSSAFEDMRRVAWEVQRTGGGERLLARLTGQIDAVAAQVAGAKARHVFCLEWPRPLYNSGHWTPELAALAGGRDDLAAAGAKSRPIAWDRLRDYDPEIIVAMVCGFERERASRELATVWDYPGFDRMRAVRENNVWVVDGPRYFSQAGPGMVDGLKILAKIFHPDRMGAPLPSEAVRLPPPARLPAAL